MLKKLAVFVKRYLFSLRKISSFFQPFERRGESGIFRIWGLFVLITTFCSVFVACSGSEQATRILGVNLQPWEELPEINPEWITPEFSVQITYKDFFNDVHVSSPIRMNPSMQSWDDHVLLFHLYSEGGKFLGIGGKKEQNFFVFSARFSKNIRKVKKGFPIHIYFGGSYIEDMSPGSFAKTSWAIPDARSAPTATRLLRNMKPCESLSFISEFVGEDGQRYKYTSPHLMVRLSSVPLWGKSSTENIVACSEGRTQ